MVAAARRSQFRGLLVPVLRLTGFPPSGTVGWWLIFACRSIETIAFPLVYGSSWLGLFVFITVAARKPPRSAVRLIAIYHGGERRRRPDRRPLSHDLALLQGG